MTRKIAKLVVHLSRLISEAINDDELYIFCTINNLVEMREGYFFVISENNKKIAFGCFAIGLNDSNFRQLLYFSVNPELRGQGLGERALRTVLTQEVKKESGCCLACKSELQPFYERLGFTLQQDDGDFISMILSSSPLTSDQKVIRLYKPNGDDINKNLPEIEKEYGVYLKPVS